MMENKIDFIEYFDLLSAALEKGIAETLCIYKNKQKHFSGVDDPKKAVTIVASLLTDAMIEWIRTLPEQSVLIKEEITNAYIAGSNIASVVLADHLCKSEKG